MILRELEIRNFMSLERVVLTGLGSMNVQDLIKKILALPRLPQN